jgi:nucleotide-binding universal stress UspA family protein
MFENVLVGVDGRPTGRDAIALSKRLVSSGGQLTLLHAHAPDVPILGALSHELMRVARTSGERLLAEERERAGVEATLVSVASDSPGAALHVHAESQAADLIVVGSCRRGPFGRVMVGDDTRAALNGSPCAVAVATRGYADEPRPLERVGVAYNGSPESRRALEVARQIAASTDASVKALEVVGIPTYAYAGAAAPIDETIGPILEEASQRMHSLPGVEGRAAYGITGEELAAFGDEVDILVVGSRSYGPLRRLIAGSTTNYLERHARCSLLILPRGITPEEAPVDERRGHEQASIPG